MEEDVEEEDEEEEVVGVAGVSSFLRGGEEGEGETPVTTATAEQIMELLDQLEVGSNSHYHKAGVREVMVTCRHCTGELVTV